MPRTDLEKLEFYQLLENLSHYCFTDYGKQFALNLLPSSLAEEVYFRLSQTRRSYHFSTA